MVLFETSGVDLARWGEEQVAERVGGDAGYLGRLLKDHTGYGFWMWRHARLMREAISKVLLTNEQVAQIAYQLGYEHPRQFSREFRSFFGVSPRALRLLVHLRLG
jgi:AraC-like DNA-binding protein